MTEPSTTRPQLTETQADALRMLVGDARCQDGMQLGQGTDRNLRAINGRVARALHGHGLVDLIAPPTGFPPGNEVAIPTDEGKAWARFDGGVAAGTEQLMREAVEASVYRIRPDGDLWVVDTPEGKPIAGGAWASADDAMAFIDAAVGRQLDWEAVTGGGYEADTTGGETSDEGEILEDQSEDADECECDEHPDSLGDDWHVDGCDADADLDTTDLPAEPSPAGTAAPTEPPPVGAAPRTFEGTRIVDDAIKMKASVIDGGADLRHGDEAVVLQIIHVVDVGHPGNESGVTRTIIAKPVTGYLLDVELGEKLVDGLARLRAEERSGGATLIDPDDDPGADLSDVVEKLNREERDARDEDGRRDYGDRYDDDPAPADRGVPDEVTDERILAVHDILQAGGAAGHPVRSLDENALRILVNDGRARVVPDWWLDDISRRVEIGDQLPWAWTTETPADQAMAVLEDAERTRPQVLINRIDGDWAAAWPEDWGDAPTTAATAVDLMDQALQHVTDLHGDVEDLDWQRTPQGAWVADLPAQPAEEVPY